MCDIHVTKRLTLYYVLHYIKILEGPASFFFSFYMHFVFSLTSVSLSLVLFDENKKKIISLGRGAYTNENELKKNEKIIK